MRLMLTLSGPPVSVNVYCFVGTPPFSVFTNVRRAFLVLVNVQVTVSPAARWIVAVAPASLELAVGSTQVMSVRSQPERAAR